jgi:hypothetical protein
MPPQDASGGRRDRRVPDERLWQVGFLVGSVLGAAITVAGRQLEGSAREAGLVEGRRVEGAIARLRGRPARQQAELRAVEATARPRWRA